MPASPTSAPRSASRPAGRRQLTISAGSSRRSTPPAGDHEPSAGLGRPSHRPAFDEAWKNAAASARRAGGRGTHVKAPLFEYHRAVSAQEAIDLLAEHGDEARVLAGGQSRIPLLSLRLARPARLIDINGAPDLAGVEANGALELGAMVRHRVAERSEQVADRNPLLAAAMRFIGHAAIRNRGTIGGSIAHADPAAELPAVLLALDGEAVVESRRGTRIIPAAQLFQGFLTTAVEPDELLTAVRVPSLPESAGWAVQEVSRRSGGFPAGRGATRLGVGGDGRIAEARMAFSGVAGTPVRAAAAEAALIGEVPSSELWQRAAATAAADLDPPGDLHGTTAYRRQLASVLAKRSLTEAHQRVEGTR